MQIDVNKLGLIIKQQYKSRSVGQATFSNNCLIHKYLRKHKELLFIYWKLIPKMFQTVIQISRKMN